MEPLVHLVKVILISSLFSWGTSSILITDQYMVREINFTHGIGDPQKKTEYAMYDLDKNIIYQIDPEMNFRISYPAGAVQESRPENEDELFTAKRIGSTISKDEFGGFHCKLEKLEFEKTDAMDSSTPVRYTDNSYFAKIPWLDARLNTKDKRVFAGFERQEYAPYTYLIYEFIQYQDADPRDLIVRIIEQKQEDTTLLSRLLRLPIRTE